jgi:acid phosphatase type 7
MSKLFASLVAALLLVANLFFIPAREIPNLAIQSTSTLTPQADAYVDSSSPGTNYGTRITLRVDGSPTVRSYLRFDLSTLSGTIAQATLRIYANSSAAGGIRVYPVSSSTWDETKLTYSNAPIVGNNFITTGAVNAGSWNELDVTSLITSSGLVSLALGTPGATAISLASRESGAHAPQLVVSANSPATPTATVSTAISTPTSTVSTAISTPTSTRSPSPSPTVTLTPTATNTPDASFTPTSTQTPGPTLTLTPTPTASTSLTPVADAYVDSSSSGSNYGSGSTLRIDGSPTVRSYLRFDLSRVSGTIAQARLRIYANSASTSGISLYPVSDSTWGETNITFSTAPAIGTLFATTGAVRAGTWNEVDVTNLIKSKGLVSLALGTPGATAISLASRESGANAPQLVVYTGQSNSALLLAAGDIAKCLGSTPSPTNGAMITSDMLLNASGALFTLGDNSNDAGSPSDYATCFDPTWGRLKSRINPAPGNHDQIYDNQAVPYFDYFGAASHPDDFGYYSLDLGAWHIVVLNAECGVGKVGCGAGSTQEKWLRADLAAHSQKCTLAIWHQPLFTSGTQVGTPGMLAFWQALYDYHAEIILNGHDHNYERFAPQDPNANPDPANGLREFVVGTGGASLDVSTLPLAANEEVRSAAAYGYIQLTLKPDSYTWQFIPQPGKTFTDSGTGVCH